MLLFLRTKVIYKDKKPNMKGSLLISANHKGYLDPLIVHTAFKSRRLHCLATKDLFKNKFWKTFFTLMNCIETDKANFNLSSFHTIIERLERGCAVVVFPEGQINSDDQKDVLPFKAGISLMAYKGNAPIIPAYIIPREKWYQRQRVIIGEAIDIRTIVGENPSLSEITGACSVLREKELELHEYYETHYNKKPVKNNISEGIENEQRNIQKVH